MDFLKKICHRMAPHQKPFHQIRLPEHHPHTSYKICVHLREERRERNNTSEYINYNLFELQKSYEDRPDHRSYIQNKKLKQPTDGLIAQLVEHCTGIAKVMGSNPVQA